MKQKFSYSVAIMAMVLLLYSCQPHDPFCYQHPHGAQVRIDVDWSEFKEDQPDGMTLLVFPSDGNSAPKQHITHTITHAVMELMPDSYTAMVHNQSASEFGSVIFSGMDHYSTALVQPERTSSTWYKPVDDEILVLNPEWLAFNHCGAVVTEEMVDGGVEWEEDYEHTTRADNIKETLIATLVPQNVIYTLHVSVRIKGSNNYRAARAAFSGLADGYFIGLEEYHSKKVTHLMENWTLDGSTSGTDSLRIGSISSEITCFGLPSTHTGKAEENVLRLSILLADNKTRVNRMFNVGSRIYQRTTNGSPLHLYLDLELSEKLPDVTPYEGDTGASGFDAEVNDWGDEENKDIGM